MTETGIWDLAEATEHHAFSYKLAKFIGEYLPKEKMLIDFGCGSGTYLRYFHDIGFKLLHGVEGMELPFEFGGVAVQDLSKSIIKDPIGNSLCLEVGEHIPSQYEHIFLDNICNNTNGKLILSWAIPSQDGVGHVNCRDNQWVVDEVCSRGFTANLVDTIEIRKHVDNHTAYFKDTLMIFDKI